MKQEDKYLDHLFESAREEAPQRSFEEVAEVFAASTSTTLLGLAKGWFLKNISLNSILFLSVGTLGLIGAFLFSSSKDISQNEVNENQIVTNQIQKTSSPKDIKQKELIEISPIQTSNDLVKNEIKSSQKFSKTKSKKQNFKKTIISESPLLPSIFTKLKLETKTKIQLAIATVVDKKTIKKNESKTVFQGYQPKSKTDELVVSPWVSGEEASSVNWKIKRNMNAPIKNETEIVLQHFLNTKYLEQVFERNENGYHKPLKMLVHYSINEYYNVHFLGRKVRLLNEIVAPDFDPNKPYVDVKKFRIKKSKAIFNFTYKDYNIQMELRRVGEGWKRHKLKVKQNKELKVNMKFLKNLVPEHPL